MTAEAILDAAELVAGDDGFGALTIRAVAAQVGAAPMALYRHFPSKDELVVALLDRVLGRFESGPPTDDWSADLRSFAIAHRRVLDAHPWALGAIFSHPSPGPNATRIGEEALSILDRPGFGARESVAIFSGLIALNYGWVSFNATRIVGPDAAASVAKALGSIAAEAFPLTAAAAAEMAGHGSEEHYRLVLDMQIEGIRSAASGRG